ncbi:hypothetical protein JD969_01375 [Planctomycetota bacterium]|nr:hypothetical protein JD969_01375 [Planctomycetota bacterium]
MPGRLFLTTLFFICTSIATLTAQSANPTPSTDPSPSPVADPAPQLTPEQTQPQPTEDLTPTIPPAIDLYLEAFDQLALPMQNEPDQLLQITDKFQISNAFTEEELLRAELTLASNQIALTNLRNISPGTPVHWPVDLTNTATYSQDTPHLPKLSRAARIIYLDALIAAHLKDADRLTTDLRHLISISNSLSNDQHLTALETRLSILSFLQDLQVLLPLNILQPDQLLDIQRDLKALDLIPHIKSVILYERSQALIYTQDYINDVILPSSTPKPLTDEQIQSNQQNFTKFMTEFLTQLEIYQFDFTTLAKQADELPETELLTKNLIPIFASTTERYTIAQASINTTIVALALQRYKLAYNEYPPTLDKLVPDYLISIPIDPFDRSPLRYIYDDQTQTAVIYATGPDTLDNNGRAFTSQAVPTFGQRPASPSPTYIYTDITFNLGPYQKAHFPESIITNEPATTPTNEPAEQPTSP